MMTDYAETIRRLENELEQAKDELKRKDKQIETLKKTSKSQETHLNLQKQKISELENRKASTVKEDDSRIKELNGKIITLNDELLHQKNLSKKMEEQCEILKREIQELHLKQKEEKQILAQNFQVQKFKLDLCVKVAQTENSTLENQLSKAKKRIEELKEELNNAKLTQNFSNSLPIKLIQDSSQDDQDYFQDEKNDKPASKTNSFDEEETYIPEKHEKYFNYYSKYYKKLKKEERVQFLNIISVDAENKLDEIYEESELRIE